MLHPHKVEHYTTTKHCGLENKCYTFTMCSTLVCTLTHMYVCAHTTQTFIEKEIHHWWHYIIFLLYSVCISQTYYSEHAVLTIHKEQGDWCVVVHANNHSTQEAEARGWGAQGQSLRPPWATRGLASNFQSFLFSLNVFTNSLIH